MASGNEPQPFDLSLKTSLGNIQGTGTLTLSEPITNYKFVVIRVGYYASGFPTFGIVTVPVPALVISSTISYSTSIFTVDGSSTGECKFTFDDDSTFHVHTIPNDTWYCNVNGVR